MRRWLIPLVAALMLASAQPVLGAHPERGVVRTLVDTNNALCHNPEGIAASPKGLLYAAGISGNICVYTRSGERVRVIPVAAGHALLGELFVDGQIYVADNNGDFSGGRVIRVDATSGAVTTIASGFLNTNAFAMDEAGRLFVSDSFAGAVYTVNTRTGATALWKQDEALRSHGIPGFGANGLAFGNDGRYLYVANTGDDRIFRISVNSNGTAGAMTVFADGAAINAAMGTTHALDGADGIVFDRKGNLWVCANQTNEIQVLSPSGRLIARYRGTGSNAMDFPASPVFFKHALYVANLALGTAPQGGKISVLGTNVTGAPLVPRQGDDDDEGDDD